ncbi:MAG: sulfotransferase [Rhodobacteraceae bacterium]|nr:sulfotransferase [Paracoccaceae bacterium]
MAQKRGMTAGAAGKRLKPGRGARRVDVDAEVKQLTLLIKQFDWVSARPASAKLLKAAPSHPIVLTLAAHVALFGDNNALKARRLLSAALEQAPGHDEALYLLGLAQEATGDRSGALETARRRLALDPSCASAYYALVSNAPDEGAEALPAIEALLRCSDLDGSSRAALLASKGAVLEQAEEFGPAYSAFAASKSALDRPYDPSGVLRHLADCQALFTEAFYDQRADVGIDDRHMVFIVGMPRSGSTLVERILCAHPQIDSCGERTELGRAISQAVACPNASTGELARWAALPDPEIRRAARWYLDAVRPCLRNPSSRRWIDKSPANIHHCGLIAMMFPNARIIITHRDPRDIAISCLTRLFSNGLSYTENFERFTHYYILQREYARHWRQVLGERVIEVRYEDVVADLERQAGRLVDHVGLEWEPACAAPHVGRSTVLTASAAQVRQPIYDSSIGRWRRYEAHMGELCEMLAAYEAAEAHPGGAATSPISPI